MTDQHVDAPNCPVCQHSLDVAGSDERPYWLCPRCGYTALAV